LTVYVNRGSKNHLGSGSQKSLARIIAGVCWHRLGYAMKNTILDRSTVNLAVVALLTLLFAGCAVESPRTENLSMGATAAHMRTGGRVIEQTDYLQPDPSDSPEFYQWGDRKNVWD
jgi:hypothetical protein